MAEPGRAIRCCQVNCLPCVLYIANGGTPTEECCAGVSNLIKRQCIKDAASRLPKTDEALASSPPVACNIQINVPISKETNCKA